MNTIIVQSNLNTLQPCAEGFTLIGGRLNVSRVVGHKRGIEDGFNSFNHIIKVYMTFIRRLQTDGKPVSCRIYWSKTKINGIL